MSALSDDRLGAVRALLETAPDSVVRDLDAALRADASPALRTVRAMVQAEVEDRAVRNVVVAPILPLCSPRIDGFQQLLFPSGVLARLWRGVRALEPRAVTVASSALTLSAEDDAVPPACDALCRSAAAAIRARRPEMGATVAYLEEFRAGAADQFAGHLELAPLARPAVRRLPAWLRNMSGEHAAAVRLLFKDADAVAADASPRLLEILLAQVGEPWRLLRVISAVTNRGGDRYLSASELADYCERVMADIDRRLLAVRAFDYDGGAPAGTAAGEALGVALSEIAEFEACLELSREGPWGQRIAKQKEALSAQVEGHLKRCPRVVSEALPLQPVRIGGAVVRSEPRLDAGPDPRLVRRALASLAFFDGSRPHAAHGGYGSLRGRVGEEVTHRLDAYVEDLLAAIHAGDPGLDHARAYLEAAADFMGLAQDQRAAQIVRRRAAAAAA